MELYIPQDELKACTEILKEEKVTFEVSDKVFSLVVDGKEIAKVTQVKAKILEIEVPVIYDQGPEITIRAFRLPSGKKVILTDAGGNFMRVVEPPPGWAR